MSANPIYAEAGRRGLVIPLPAFRARLGGDAALRKIYGALTVVENVHPGRPRGMARGTRKAYQVVRENGSEFLIIPRVKGPLLLQARNGAGRPLLDGVRAAPDALPPPRRITEGRCELPEGLLYEYQEAAVDFLCGADGPLGDKAVAEHRGVAYLQMETGLGKTRVALAVIARRRAPALVVVPTEAIGEQFIEEAEETFPEMRVGFYHNQRKGSRKPPPGPLSHDVVVIIINTFRGKGPGFMEGFGTAVLDEAHENHAPCNSQALWLCQAVPAVLGLSATPLERPDGFDRYVHLHLGPVIQPKDIPGFDVTAVRFRGAVRVVEYAGHPDHCETATTPAGTMSAVLTIGNIIGDRARMRLVAAEVERLCRLHETASPEELLQLGLGPRPEADATPTHPAGEIRRHGVFVFAELREALPALKRELVAKVGHDGVFAPEIDAEPGDKVSILRGGVAKTAVGSARRAGAHVVLTTYGYSRRGISLADMTSIVLATPRRNGTRQVLGRILRRGSDESIVRQVVDIVDTRTGLKSQVADRRKVYVEKMYPISKVAFGWESYTEGAGRPVADEGGDAPSPEFSEMSLGDLLAAALGTDEQGPILPEAELSPGGD